MTAVSSSSGSKVAMYAERIQTSLVPARQVVEKRLAEVEYERAEYEDLAGRLKTLEKNGGGPETTLTELGAGVWVDAVIPKTDQILLDLGFDIHLELPLHQAAAYAENRAKMLEKRRVLAEQKWAQITWQIQQASCGLGLNAPASV